MSKQDDEGSTFVTRGQLAKRYSVVERTISRWLEDESLGFPQPMFVGARLFFRLTEIEIWERDRAAASRKQAAA